MKRLQPETTSIVKLSYLEMIPMELWNNIYIEWLPQPMLQVISRLNTNFHQYVSEMNIDFGAIERLDIYAAANNYPSLILWFRENNASKDGDINWCKTTAVAAMKGHLDLFRVLEVKNFEIDSSSITGAIIGNNISILDWLYNNSDCFGNDPEIIKTIFDTSSICGQLDIIKWAITKDFLMDTKRIVFFACVGGHLHILNWLVEEKILRTTLNSTFKKLYELCAVSITTNNRESIYEWLFARGISVNLTMFNRAAYNGDLNLLKWFKDLGFNNISFDAVGEAARRGHYETTVWLIENLLENGHATITSLTNIGLPCCVVSGGNLQLVKWCKAHGIIIIGFIYIEIALLNGSIDILDWLVDENGFQLPENLFKTFIKRSIPKTVFSVLDWLKMKNYPWTPDLYNYAFIWDRQDVILWAKKNELPGFKQEYLTASKPRIRTKTSIFYDIIKILISITRFEGLSGINLL